MPCLRRPTGPGETLIAECTRERLQINDPKGTDLLRLVDRNGLDAVVDVESDNDCSDMRL